MKYESELIQEILEQRGHEFPDLHYQSECIESWIEETKGAYPKLCDYESEWLNYIVENPIGEFPYETVTTNSTATVNHVVPFEYKSAILSGSTKYRDVDTGEILETFEEGRNLELVSVKMPVLTTSTTLINYDVQFTDTGKDLISDFIKIPENIKGKILYPSFNTNKINEKTSKQFGMETYDSNKQLLSRKGYWLNNCYSGLSPIILNEEVNYVKFEAWSCYELLGSNGKIGLTEMKNINYIPYKSNILTVNEEVELGSVGEVKDELNLLTGQLTQRTETRAYQEGDESNSEVLTDMTNTRYKLPKEAIKTVDLTVVNQDGEPLNKIKPIEGTMHIKVSGTPLNPTAVLEVPVEAITQNLNSFIVEE